MAESNSSSDQMSLWDIMSSEPKFQIWSMLSIYQELSLADLARLTYKSKSTIHEHLKKMIEGGIVYETRSEPSKSNIEKKYYGLAPEIQEDTKCCTDKRSSIPEKELFCQKITSRLDLVKIQIQMLQTWEKFLTSLLTNCQETDCELAMSIYKKLEQEYFHPMDALSFYSVDHAKNHLQNCYKMYQESERGEEKIQNDFRQQHDGKLSLPKPIMAAINIIPIRFALDYLAEQKQLLKRTPNIHDESE
jgi:DNA-binding MarR family transcriptional regulator